MSEHKDLTPENSESILPKEPKISIGEQIENRAAEKDPVFAHWLRQKRAAKRMKYRVKDW
jgi:hypothetical protein